jgi:catechol 2,3-dioxygenase-like lactoylglutathione lyase family enzyme
MKGTTPMNAPTLATRLQNHVSIDTDDLARSRAFYAALLGHEPVLEKPDYVRFWPAELGLVLALHARPSRASGTVTLGTGALQHLGLLFPDAEGLRAARARLAQAGFASHGEEHTECCYAELDQYWATDPSGVRWELFLSHQDVVEAPASSTRASGCCAPSCCS